MHSSQWCGAGFLLSLSSSLSACQIYFVAKERPAPSQSHTLRSWTTNQHTLQTRIFNHKRNNNNKLHVFDDERKEREWMSERERETCRIHIITIAVGYTSRHSGQMHSSGSSGPEWRIHQYGFIDKVKVFFFCVFHWVLRLHFYRLLAGCIFAHVGIISIIKPCLRWLLW